MAWLRKHFHRASCHGELDRWEREGSIDEHLNIEQHIERARANGHLSECEADHIMRCQDELRQRVEEERRDRRVQRHLLVSASNVFLSLTQGSYDRDLGER
jgi:hypothetical protein